MSSTPTLFNSGTRRSQLSSCYLTTVADDLDGIYEALKENALLSKFAGGLGNDWTSVRALGSHIKGTNGKSQGVVPFLKVVNDTAVAVNQAASARVRCVPIWRPGTSTSRNSRVAQEHRRRPPPHARHEYLELDPRSVHEARDGRCGVDPVLASNCPDLHDKFGTEFEKAYLAYEAKVASGELSCSRRCLRSRCGARC